MKKENFELCYPILERSKDSFLNKIKSINNENVHLLELRIDYLLAAKLNIDDIICIINEVRKLTKSKTITTIRTKREGGEIDLQDEIYSEYIKRIYNEADTDIIDVEYQYYQENVDFYNSLFKNKSKRVIISAHEFNRTYIENEYIDIFKNMANSSGNIVKFAIKVNTKEELFEYMMAAKNSQQWLVKLDKESIFIAMGEIGKLSRVWPEFTNTRVVFLTAYENANKLGQFTYESFMKTRKKLEKMVKN